MITITMIQKRKFRIIKNPIKKTLEIQRKKMIKKSRFKISNEMIRD